MRFRWKMAVPDLGLCFCDCIPVFCFQNHTNKMLSLTGASGGYYRGFCFL